MSGAPMPAEPTTNLYYGGQAVIEGVMIRGPRHMAVAVRAPDGRIVRRTEELTGMYTGRVRRMPIVRGGVVLIETLTLGVRALMWASNVVMGNDREEAGKLQIVLSLA